MNDCRDAALQLNEQGLPITVCPVDGLSFKMEASRGKVPLGVGWDDGMNGGWGESWQHKEWRPEEIERVFKRFPTANVGLQLGPRSGFVDFETDSKDEEAALWRLFDDDLPIAPKFGSKRGAHHFHRWHDRLAETKKAIVKFNGLGCRIGANEMGAHSVVPPSVAHGIRREWLPGLSLYEVHPPELPSIVIERLIEAASDKTSEKLTGAMGSDVTAAVADMLRMTVDADENDGRKRLFACTCRCVEYDLSDSDAIAAMRLYEVKLPFPRIWTDAEILQRVRYAESKVKRGSAIIIANYHTIEVENDEGEKDTITVPRSMSDIITDIERRTGNWPRRIDNVLFVDDPKHGLGWFDRQKTSGMFGWLRRRFRVQWAKGGSLVAQGELFAEIERTAQRYESIEILPHEPPLPNVYYSGTRPRPGDGSHLRKLLDRFRPQTTVDRDLIQAAFMTPFWGALPGCRPAFAITSDEGRGVGKSKVPESIGYLCGGHIDVSAGEDIEALKTRMLTPSARTKRIALLDNVKSLKFSWAELEAMITSPVISGRQLYIGEGQRPNHLTWFLTLNGISLGTDMAQRTIVVKVSRGKNNGPWWEDTRRFIDEHRDQIIGDIIAALKAEPFPLDEYSRWASWEMHVLCRLPEPGEAQRVILERQGEANTEADEADIIEDYFSTQLERLGYAAESECVRIPVAIVARWYGWASGEQARTAAVTRRLKQMADEGQLKRLAPDAGRTYGRCFVWTGQHADLNEPIKNDLEQRLAKRQEERERGF